MSSSRRVSDVLGASFYSPGGTQSTSHQPSPPPGPFTSRPGYPPQFSGLVRPASTPPIISAQNNSTTRQSPSPGAAPQPPRKRRRQHLNASPATWPMPIPGSTRTVAFATEEQATAHQRAVGGAYVTERQIRSLIQQKRTDMEISQQLGVETATVRHVRRSVPIRPRTMLLPDGRLSSDGRTFILQLFALGIDDIDASSRTGLDVARITQLRQEVNMTEFGNVGERLYQDLAWGSRR